MTTANILAEKDKDIELICKLDTKGNISLWWKKNGEPIQGKLIL